MEKERMKEAFRLAFYGKGGIGKTTVCCNVSAMLASRGYRVLHIGCDPKADSTRLLTAQRIPNVLEQMARLGGDIKISDILFPGKQDGLFCIEAGGPKAGTGCAGAGISAMNELLHELDLFEMGWDVILYDVLGDVVCGGFSVPMKGEYVDKVFVISSSEYMSVYAANNILQAVDLFSYHDSCLFGGIIWNHCQTDWDLELADSFSQLTRAEVIAYIDEWQELQRYDYAKKLIVQEQKPEKLWNQFSDLTDRILQRQQMTDQQKRIAPCSMVQLEEWREAISRWNGK